MLEVETDQPRTWTVAQVEAQQRKAHELEQRIVELRASEAELSAQITQALADGRDVEELTCQRRESTGLREDEAALPVLRQKIAERREIALRAEAAKRLVAIARAHGSVRSQFVEQDIARIEARAAELIDAMQKAADRFRRLQDLEVESLALLDRWGDLTPPDITRVAPPAGQERAIVAIRRVREIALANPQKLPRRLVDVPGRVAWRLISRIEGETAELLNQSCGPFDEAEHDRRYREAQDATRDRGDAARLAEITRFDAWLTATLADGPVPIAEVERQARGASMRFERDRNAPGCSVREAADRLGAFVVIRNEGDDAPHWALRAADGFFVPKEHTRSARSASAMRA